MKVDLEQLEEMQKELFKQQCDLDIQKAMVKHFIKKEKDKQLTLTDVVVSFCQCTELNNYNDEIMGYDTCIKCDKPIDR